MGVEPKPFSLSEALTPLEMENIFWQLISLPKIFALDSMLTMQMFAFS